MDLAAALVSLLRSHGHEAGFARREVLLSSTELSALTGYEVLEHARALLTTAGITMQPQGRATLLELVGGYFHYRTERYEIHPFLFPKPHAAVQAPPSTHVADHYLERVTDKLPYQLLLDTTVALPKPTRSREELLLRPGVHLGLGRPGRLLAESATVPPQSRPLLSLKLSTPGRSSLDLTLPLDRLGDGFLYLRFIPIEAEATTLFEDPGLFASYPPWLLHLRVVATLGGEPVASGGLHPLGERLRLDLDYPAADGSPRRDQTYLLAGEHTLLAVNSWAPLAPTEPTPPLDPVAGRQTSAADYFTRELERSASVLTSLLGVSHARSPIVVLVRQGLRVHPLRGLPFYLRRDMAVMDVVEATAQAVGDSQAANLFNLLHGLTISALEHASLEHAYGVPSISTVRAFQLVGPRGIRRRRLEKGDEELEKLVALQRSSRYSRSTVLWMTPVLTCEAWTGRAYIVEDAARRSREFYIEGSLRGGQTCRAIE